MKRKSLILSEKAAEALKEAQEIDARAKELLKQEEDAKSAVEEQIKEICGKKYFCGVVLRKADLLSILSIMIDTQENVSIPFKLYFNDKEEIPENLNENGTV